MSNYVKATDFSVKDALVTGDPNKRIKGAEIDDEFDAIATAIGTKANIASPALTGTPTAPTATASTNNTQIATTAFVQLNGVPIGTILIWGGAIVDIPIGYLLCDGSGGTPDLRNRFVLGAGDTYAVNAIGGSADAIVVQHTHAVTDAGHAHPNTLQTVGVAGAPLESGNDYALVNNDGGLAVTGITIANAGVSGINANLPPYYALAYIKRVS